MAKHYKNPRKENNKEKANKSQKTKKLNTIKNIILIVLVLILITCVGIIIYFTINRNKINKQNEELKNIVSNDESASKDLNEKTERMIQLEQLKVENSDIVGWLEIPNTDISYPVLQGVDNDFYMTHNYKKEYSPEGSLFLDKDYDWNIPSSNLLIYGHNNRGTNAMFCGLLNFKDVNFYNSHKTIRFTTIDEDCEYEILSTFLSRVYYKSEKNVFRYYYFINANNKQEFDEFVANCKKASIYDTGVTAEYGDQLITLSTCDFYTQDGRLAVVARKVKQ